MARPGRSDSGGGPQRDVPQLCAVPGEQVHLLNSSPRPGNDAPPVPWNRDLSVTHDESSDVRVDSHRAVVDPAAAGRPQSPGTAVQNAAGAFSCRHQGISAGRSGESHRQLCRTMGESVVLRRPPPPPSIIHSPSCSARTWTSSTVHPTLLRANIVTAMSPATSTAIAGWRRRRLNLVTGVTSRDAMTGGSRPGRRRPCRQPMWP